MRILTYLMILALTSSFVFQSDQEEKTFHLSKQKAEMTEVQTSK